MAAPGLANTTIEPPLAGKALVEISRVFLFESHQRPSGTIAARDGGTMQQGNFGPLPASVARLSTGEGTCTRPAPLHRSRFFCETAKAHHVASRTGERLFACPNPAGTSSLFFFFEDRTYAGASL